MDPSAALATSGQRPPVGAPLFAQPPSRCLDCPEAVSCPRTRITGHRVGCRDGPEPKPRERRAVRSLRHGRGVGKSTVRRHLRGGEREGVRASEARRHRIRRCGQKVQSAERRRLCFCLQRRHVPSRAAEPSKHPQKGSPTCLSRTAAQGLSGRITVSPRVRRAGSLLGRPAIPWGRRKKQKRREKKQCSKPPSSSTGMYHRTFRCVSTNVEDPPFSVKRSETKAKDREEQEFSSAADVPPQSTRQNDTVVRT
ncbi:hypothetical protein B0T11DRAFT_8976 [Plectosphaerella cucumerina]|uniref:Uncharacterized protein n=1 Tax=Plectosphaerella cucumerina TaxID=40658 RepID=A0A8K0TT33_9PEZI|nr:hypothetical protein B0T11DRAFT_8976 [Plectosphaerella cucumerina]